MRFVFEVPTGMRPFGQAIGKVLLVIGALVFFFGDRALREMWSWNFVPAELVGIGAGILLMVLGGLLQAAFKAENDPDENSE